MITNLMLLLILIGIVFIITKIINIEENSNKANHYKEQLRITKFNLEWITKDNNELRNIFNEANPILEKAKEYINKVEKVDNLE